MVTPVSPVRQPSNNPNSSRETNPFNHAPNSAPPILPTQSNPVRSRFSLESSPERTYARAPNRPVARKATCTVPAITAESTDVSAYKATVRKIPPGPIAVIPIPETKAMPISRAASPSPNGRATLTTMVAPFFFENSTKCLEPTQVVGEARDTSGKQRLTQQALYDGNHQ